LQTPSFAAPLLGYPACVRIRIVKAMSGILDGHSLSALIPGTVYEIDEHLAIQLIALYGAVEDASDTPAVPLDVPDTAFELPGVTGGVHILQHERRKKPR
jgi:hypothetical protein